MYLHLGNDQVVNEKNVIAILDMDKTTISKITREFLKVSQDEDFIINVSDDIPKTFVIAEVDKKSVVYLTNISSSTLIKRKNFFKNYK